MSRADEIARLATVKAQLLATTHTVGWGYIKKIAANVVERSIQDALDEVNPTMGELKRVKAKAMQQGLADLFSAIEAGMAFDPKQLEDTSGLGNLEEAWSGDRTNE